MANISSFSVQILKFGVPTSDTPLTCVAWMVHHGRTLIINDLYVLMFISFPINAPISKSISYVRELKNTPNFSSA